MYTGAKILIICFCWSKMVLIFKIIAPKIAVSVNFGVFLLQKFALKGEMLYLCTVRLKDPICF